MATSYTLKRLSDVVRRTAPVWYIHDDEFYQPSSIDWFLDRATMVAKTGERVKLSDGPGKPESRLKTIDQWPSTVDDADYWLEVADADLAGDYTTARSYVSIRRVKDGFLDISHWFWYPGNGCGTARVRTLAFDTTIATEEAVALTTLGFHVSDWEKVTVRVTDDDANAISEIYFAQHAGGHWLKPDQVEFDASGSFAAHASKNGHASYPSVGENYTSHIKTAPNGVWAKLTPAALEIWLRNDTMKGKRSIDCKVHHEIVHIHETIALAPDPSDASTDFSAVPFFGRVTVTAGQPPVMQEPTWLQYPYRWGPETEQKISHEVVFEALKMAIGPLMIYGVLTVGMMLPILGSVAGLLVPTFVKMENENGKPGPKVKFTSGGVVDEESGPEPDNLFTDAVNDGVSSMVDWVENAGKDVASWTVNAADDTADWIKDTGNAGIDWTVGAADDTASWFKGAANDVADWTTGAANSVADAADDAANWTKGAANTVADKLDPRNW